MSWLEPRARNTAYDKQRQFRLQDPATQEYLHLSGEGSVKDDTYAWLGYRYQGRNLRQAAQDQDKPFPYRLVRAKI